MNVYIDNVLSRAITISADNKAPSYYEGMLYDPVLSNALLFTGPSTMITADFPLNEFADSVAILGCNWTIGHLIIKSQDFIVYESDITSGGYNTVIKLPDTYMITGLDITLDAQETLSIGILFVGKRLELPLFNEGFKYDLAINGKGERTYYGIAYGLKRPGLKSFSVTFQDINNNMRGIFEDYINNVQYITAHLVEPYETEKFQPMYATLTDAGKFSQRKNSDFHWDTGLSYMEAK